MLTNFLNPNSRRQTFVSGPGTTFDAGHLCHSYTDLPGKIFLSFHFIVFFPLIFGTIFGTIFGLSHALCRKRLAYSADEAWLSSKPSSLQVLACY